MEPSEVYRFLCGAQPEFDAHVFGSVLALAVADRAQGGGPIVWSVGLEAPRLSVLLDRYFSRAAGAIRAIVQDLPIDRSDDEICLADLLSRFAVRGSAAAKDMALMIARRAQSPNHLWQDLGLRNRDELSCLMRNYFPGLAERNNRDMKWKKFLYRMICRDGGYSLCTAPSCSECDDFALCFGAEDGESFMARVRRDQDLARIV